MKKDVECPHIANSKNGGYYYELTDVTFDICPKCNSQLLKKMISQKDLENSMEVQMAKITKTSKKKKKKKAATVSKK